MKKDKLSRTNIIIYCICIIPVVWSALVIAPCFNNGLTSFISEFSKALSHPFNISFCEDSLKTVLIFLGIYGIGIGIYITDEKNYRKREEHGSARWGRTQEINKKYKNREKEDNNIILTQNVALGLDGHKHKRNLNVLVCGGSGAGKSRSYALPNIMNTAGADKMSIVVTDPKGELLASTGKMLEKCGYRVLVLDLISPQNSTKYNPFRYLTNDNDIQRLVTNLFQNTTPKGSKSQDPFWDQAAQMLLLALIFYLHYEAREYDQNFATVLDLIRAGEVNEENSAYMSTLDILFEDLEKKKPDHIALKYYKAYHSGAGKTLKSIQITLLSRLEKFNLPSISSLTMTDEFDLATLGEQKTAVFCVIPDNDTSFNFLVGMLYTQMFQQLYYSADRVHGGRLPLHVHFILDEFPNVALPDQFDKLLATMRSREISVSIIIQNMAQLKALYEKEHESIVGNCDEYIYLGGNEKETHKYVSELMGKETIDMNTYGKSQGRNGSYSTNYQIGGRELMTPDEVRMLDNQYALLFIRGERPVRDLKFDISKHPRFKQTSSGGADAYDHTCKEYSNSEIIFDYVDTTFDLDKNIEKSDFYIYSSEELESILEKNESEEN